jgi:acetolactate synthase-1/2/3 large subunit
VAVSRAFPAGHDVGRETTRPKDEAEAGRQHTAADTRVLGSVATAVLRALTAEGVEAIFLNPGSDTAPLQEALAVLEATGEAVPRVVLCLHEGVALAAAHAYFAVTGRPQLVMVHVDVGTQNLGSMVHNADRGDAGVVILAGRTPTTSYGELPGGRDAGVHWLQDVPDQAGIVRQYVKWTADIEPATARQTVARAFEVARTGVPGPVYLTAAREALMQPSAESGAAPAKRTIFAPPAPDPAGVRQAAAWLREARNPVIVTSRLGQRPEAVDALVELAGLTGALVLDGRERMNFPSDHPAYVGSGRQVAAALTRADVVLSVEAPVPWIPHTAAPSPDARVINLELDPLHASMTRWNFGVDLALACDAVSGLQALVEQVRLLGPRPDRPVAQASAPADQSPDVPPAVLTAADIGRALTERLADEDIVIEEATTSADLLRGSLRRVARGTYFRSGGSGLGWALGATLGAGLAAPDRRIITLVGDGAFVFGSPTAAFWSLQQSGRAALIIVLRNGGYAASRWPVLTLFPEGRSASTGEVVGTLFADSPDFPAIARACGVAGEQVTTREELDAALDTALGALDGGRFSLLSVAISSPWIPPRD